MATFDFPYHTVRTQYPDDQKRMSFGNGYTFSTKPLGPLERVFVLNMMGMQWFLDGNGSVETTTSPERNAARLVEFYESHRLHTEMTYPLPNRGDITVRFHKPLELPAADGNTGVLPEFEIHLIEVPSA